MDNTNAGINSYINSLTNSVSFSNFFKHIGGLFFLNIKFDNQHANYRLILFALWIAYAVSIFFTVSDLKFNQTKFTVYCCSGWFVLLALLFLFTDYSKIAPST